jgi:hypothetical protein
MTFEEFFMKKRIDLNALQAGEPGLFSEFKKHFEQMGEKSFDHTKKYWFNKLRLQFHLAPELKPEKVRMENKLAEQTITESILEEKIAAPSVGFKPKFKPGMATKPAVVSSDQKHPAPENSSTSTPEVNEAAATGDQNPPFQQEKEAMQAKANNTPRTTDDEPKESAEKGPVTQPSGFIPRFNMKMTPGAAPQSKEFKPEPPEEVKEAEAETTTEPAAPKPAGFKPRFNMKMATPKPAEDTAAEPEEPKPEPEPTDTVESQEPQAITPAETPAARPAGFKPRFNMKMAAPKPAEPVEEEQQAEAAAIAEAKTETPEVMAADETAQETDKPAEAVAPKPAGFKPRFNMKMVKPKPPEEE